MKNIHKIEKELYITNDEEIKEGDWVMSNYGELIKISYKGSKVKENVNEYCKKIILTTDQDLIADGVQSIDDEFLQWFVKNPSCEEVEVEKKFKANPKYKEGTQLTEKVGYWEYKTIIPKEEKLTYSDALKKEERIFNSTMMFKQETLEKAAEKYASYDNEYVPLADGQHDFNEVSINAFINGAKWQQERSYSKEEVLHILDTFWDRLDVWYNEGVDENFSLREWFNECELKKK